MDDLQQSQAQLGQALDKARAGEDRELASHVREGGEIFLRQLFGALRMTRLHTLDNQAYDKPIHDMHVSLRALVDLLGAVHLLTVERQVYVNDIRIRCDERADTAHQLAQEFRRHAVGGLSFHDALTEPQIRAMIESFAGVPDDTHPRKALQEVLNKRGVGALELMGVFRFRVSGEHQAAEHADIQGITGRAVGLVGATMDSLGANRMPNPLPIRRAITEILELGPDSEDLWTEARTSSAYGNHTLRVTLLALTLGKAIGLPDAALQDLGVSAMFHDVGYASREGATSEHEGYPPPFERHTGAGARMILKQRGFHEAKVHRALGCLHHHTDHDDPGGTPSLTGRILRIAEDYDTLQRPRAHGMSPAQALSSMMHHSGTRYDPVLLQALANSLGRFPPGTIMQLADGRIVRSDGMARSPETHDKPICVVLVDENGHRPRPRPHIDLAVEGKVKRVLNPKRG